MILLDDFSFIEPNGTTWTAKAAHHPPTDGDLVIDGATIPPIFWSVIGGPYEGLYRNASIVHDAECSWPHKHKWQDVHEMFYRASLAGGTSELTAKLMFAAVWHFGPRWSIDGKPYAPHVMERVGDATRMIAYIVKHPSIDLTAIEALSSDALAAGVTPAEYDQFNRQLQDCNDPNGHNLGARGARGDSQHEYRTTMSTPSQPCHGW
jgi:hypothetical protein